jgi:hypothetical protein
MQQDETGLSQGSPSRLHRSAASCVNHSMMTRTARLFACLILGAATLPLGACYVEAGPPAPAYYAPAPPPPAYGRGYVWHSYYGRPPPPR